MNDEREKVAIERLQLKPFPTGAHINKEDLRLKNSVTMAIEQMKLRQWCIEKAIESLGNIGTECPPSFLEEIINTFYNFITQPQENSNDKTA